MMCDLAETYHIFNYRQLPVEMVAVFVWGLPEKARVWKKFGYKDIDRQLLALIYDNLNWLVWAQTEDGANNMNKPKRLYDKLFTPQQEVCKDTDPVEFDSPEEFKKKWKEITNANIS